MPSRLFDHGRDLRIHVAPRLIQSRARATADAPPDLLIRALYQIHVFLDRLKLMALRDRA
jgi:hypothetical protein